MIDKLSYDEILSISKILKEQGEIVDKITKAREIDDLADFIATVERLVLWFNNQSLVIVPYVYQSSFTIGYSSINSPLCFFPSLISSAIFSPIVSILWNPGRSMFPFKSVVVGPG